MAKAAMIKIKLLSTADTGYFYVTKKNARTKTEKLAFKKYDPVVRKHVEFKETKIKKLGKFTRSSRSAWRVRQDRRRVPPAGFDRVGRRDRAAKKSRSL